MTVAARTTNDEPHNAANVAAVSLTAGDCPVARLAEQAAETLRAIYALRTDASERLPELQRPLLVQELEKEARGPTIEETRTLLWERFRSFEKPVTYQTAKSIKGALYQMLLWADEIYLIETQLFNVEALSPSDQRQIQKIQRHSGMRAHSAINVVLSVSPDPDIEIIRSWLLTPDGDPGARIERVIEAASQST